MPPERSGRTPPFAILVGEAPGEKEESGGRPFIGPTGFELKRALDAVGLRRSDCHVTNAVLCRPPGNKIDRAEREVTKRNKRLKVEKVPEEEMWLSPVEACRPRLMNEIRDVGGSAANVIALGGIAYRALTTRREKPLEVRGGPREEAFGHLLPTLHPSFVMRSRRWTGAFLADLARAKRWFTSGLTWTDPTTSYLPSPQGLIEWLKRERGTRVTYDVETAPAFPEFERYDAMHDKLRCVGLTSEDARRAIVVPFRSVADPAKLFYALDDYRLLIKILRVFFESPEWIKSGWNSGYYDRMVIERHFGVTPTPAIDGIGLHKFVEPELPHNLGYVGSVHTDIHSWKQGKTATEARTDAELWLYNARDCAVTSLSIPTLADAVKARNQSTQARWFPFLQDVCVNLHKVGMYVDQKKRREWDAKLLADAQKYLRIVREGTGYDDFNPNSTKQLQELLFDEWGLMPVDYTERGDPSTNDDSLREILAKQSLTPTQRTSLLHVRLYRRRTKFRGTYTLKLRPMYEEEIGAFFAEDDEETEEERDARFKKELKRAGIVLADGRVHGDWNPHGTLGWRLSGSNPNLMNVPNKLRDIFTEEPGWCLVGCDQAQLELRMSAALAQSVSYLTAFNERRDAHLEFCLDIFGESYEKATKDGKKGLRRTVKELTYASQYRAEIETVHSVLTSAEDDDEKLLYPNLTVSQVGAMHRKWLARAKFDGWWEATDAKFAAQGYLVDPILGLRVDFLDGPNDPQLGNKLVNFLCQSGGSAIVHIATKRFLENMPKEWQGRVFLVNQCHDSLTAKVKADHAGPQVVERDENGKVKEVRWCADKNCGCLPSRVAKFLEECFTFEVGSFPGINVRFEGESKIGNNWKET